MKNFILTFQYSPFSSNLRRIAFIPFALSWFVHLPVFLVVAYPILMAFFFIYYRLRKTTLTEIILKADIGFFFEDSPMFSFRHRLWNICHFRNYDEQKSRREKFYIFILRIYVFIFYAFFFITTIRIIHIYFPNWAEMLFQAKEIIINTINKLLANIGK